MKVHYRGASADGAGVTGREAFECVMWDHTVKVRVSGQT